MMITSATMNVKTAHKVLQRALQVLLAVLALLIAFLVQSVRNHVLAAETTLPAAEVIRLVHEEREKAAVHSNTEDPVARCARTEAQRFSHTKPDGSKWNNPLLKPKNIAQHIGQSFINIIY